MKNELVMTDIRHGGIDSGAVGNGLQEKIFNIRHI